MIETTTEVVLVIKTHCLPVWGAVWGWIGYTKIHPLIHGVISLLK